MKKIYFSILIIGLIGLFLFLFTPEKKINAKILFINQVRGNECCQKGSYDFTQRQLELFKKYHFPATFLLRYDAFRNNQFVDLFKSYSGNRFEYGIFFEVTPGLAKDAGVIYKGTEDRWYRAQYAYLVGYLSEERKKIIDTAMKQFKQQFGFYPKTTGGWMIDTFSAEYLNTTYGVETHEITREQWGTDGYALYGGSILSAYTPSKRWLFMPTYSESNSLPIRIIRQTLSDPVHNYGDLTSGYTSQPNDYGRTKGFDYFKHLLRQVEHYSQPIAVLGLENSLEKQYQDIYEKQVKYISTVVENKNIVLPKDIIRINKENYIFGADFNNTSYKSFWIETPTYRARIIQNRGNVQLTDLRVFDTSMDDPYYATQSGEKTAYWEIPYVFDSSKNGEHKVINALSQKTGELLRILGNEDWIRERTNPVVNEQFLQEIHGIVFPQLKKDTNISLHKSNGIITLQYLQKDKRKIILTFYENRISVSGIRKNEYNIQGSIGENTELKQEETNEGVLFYPRVIQKSLKKTQINSDSKNSNRVNAADISVIYNAPLSLIGRNPVRLVIVSKDSGGHPIRMSDIKIIHTNGSFYSVKIHETEGHLGEFDGMYYVDIEQKIEGTYAPILTYGSQQKKLLPISFIFDCKKDIKSCLFNPKKVVPYMRVKLEDILQRR